MTVEILGDLLTASEADRTASYRLLTFGEEGRTSKGRVTVDDGILEIPAGSIPINDEHNPAVPVGYLTASKVDGGINATAHYFDTPEGNAVFSEVTSGKRKGISMEVLKPIIRAGKLLAGALVGAGAVKAPAFPSSLLLAADVGAVEADLAGALTALEAGDVDAATAAVRAALDNLNEEPTEQEEDNVSNLNAGKPAVPAAGTPAAPADSNKLLASLAAMVAAQKPADEKLEASASAITLEKFASVIRRKTDQNMTNDKLLAAEFEAITQADVYDETAVPEYLGELWAEARYVERFAPLVSTANLTGMLVKGWRWVEGEAPIVDDWDPAFTQGDPTAEPPTSSAMNNIPSNTVHAKGEEWPAKRIAGGNRFDRVHIDFPVPGVMESFLREQTEYIKRRRDERVRQHLYTEAAKNQVAATGTDAANAWRKIIFGAMHVMEYSMPTYAVVGNDIYRDLLGSDMLENLALLETTLGLAEGSMAGFKIQPASIKDVASNGKTLVGTSKATVLHEPAGAPFRVDAQNLVNGSIDKAVFAYYLLRSDERGGIVEVTG